MKKCKCGAKLPEGMRKCYESCTFSITLKIRPAVCALPNCNYFRAEEGENMFCKHHLPKYRAMQGGRDLILFCKQNNI